MTYSIYVAVAMQGPPVDRCELVPYQYDQAGADFALMRYKARWRRSGPGDRAIVGGMMARERAVLLKGGRRPTRLPQELLGSHPKTASVSHLTDRASAAATS